MKTLIVFATHFEAEKSLFALQAAAVAENIYEYRGGQIMISGMGPDKTRHALASYVGDFDRVINIGIAGALKPEIVPDSWHEIKATSFNGKSHVLQESGAMLLTLSSPLHDEALRDVYSQTHDLVDMEGHLVAEFAAHKRKPCLLLKLVSDYCSSNTSNVIRQRISEFSEMIAQKLTQLSSEK